jgi:hypothetical protein
MSIATLSELSAAVPVWLGRDGDPITAAQIADIITLAETGIMYGRGPPLASAPVRLRFMETTATLSLATESTALPADFLEARSLTLATSPRATLEMRSPQDLNQTWAGSSAGQPESYAIQGNQLRVAPTPSPTVSATLTYWALPRLAKSNPAATNTLLANAPDVYLTAACMQAAQLLGDIADAQRWLALYQGAVGGLQQSDDAGKWSGSALIMHAPGPTP